MRFSLLKDIKNTHKHRASKILHTIELLLYAIAILMILGYSINIKTNPYNSLILFTVAIALFLLGHKIEGNIRATTWVILLKYLKTSIKDKKEISRHNHNKNK